MAGVNSFTDLKCWQESRIWSKSIFVATKTQPFADDRRLVVQINDSPASVMANIAEGFGRGTQGEFILFLGYSIGSLDETRSHVSVAYDRDNIPRADYARLFRQGTTIRKMIVAFITSMIRPGGGVKHTRKIKPWLEEVWELYERVTGKPRPERFASTAPEIPAVVRNDEPPV